MIDPLEPSIICWELRDGRYAEVARSAGSDSVALNAPFPVSLIPDEWSINPTSGSSSGSSVGRPTRQRYGASRVPHRLDL